MAQLVKPHAAPVLRPLIVPEDELAEERERARSLPSLPITSREAGDLVMLGLGGFTPLDGFMGRDDWLGVCREMQTSNGVFWPIPITVSTDTHRAMQLTAGDEVALLEPGSNHPLAVMRIREKYSIDKATECVEVFRTQDPAHPGVRMVLDQAEVNLGGPVRVLSFGHLSREFPRLFLSPAETRSAFEARGWRSVAAFQTRNPMHRSHEYLAKIGVEVCDGVLIHSLLGGLKPGDIPAAVRTRAIDALLEHYFVRDTVLHAGYPLDMRYAGPREALLHALFRQNYGCSHLLVGRDHAGVGEYYGPFDAHHIFDEIPADALEIRPIRIDWTFWCYRCDGMASMRTCRCGPEHRLLLSGTKLRELLSEGEPVPDKFSRPEVLEILQEYCRGVGAEPDRRKLG